MNAIPAPKPTPLTLRYGLHLAEGAKESAKRERTRTAIQIATSDLLDRQSLTSLTVADICKEVPIAHGTFYIHFSDLHALTGSLLLDFVAFVQLCLRGAARTHDGDTVRATTETYYLLFEQNPGLMKCLVNHLENYPEAMQAFQTLNREWVMTVVHSIRKKRPDLPEAELIRRVYALGGMVDQYLTATLLNGDPTLTAVSTDRQTVIDTLTTLWKKGLSQ